MIQRSHPRGGAKAWWTRSWTSLLLGLPSSSPCQSVPFPNEDSQSPSLALDLSTPFSGLPRLYAFPDPLSSGHPSIFLFRSQFARNRVRVPTRRASLKESGPPVNIYPRLKSNKARGRAEFTSVIKGRPEGFSRRAD